VLSVPLSVVSLLVKLVKQRQLEDFYNNLGRRFIAGDYNAILTGDQDSLLPEDAKYSKQWKETT
jgi:hypothetical protein